MMVDVRKKGVTGVPFVVIDGRWAVSGGQSAETYVQVWSLFLSTLSYAQDKHYPDF